MGEVVPLPWTDPPTPTPDLGPCEWCRSAPAAERFEVTPAKGVRGRALEPSERAVRIAVCGHCRERLAKVRYEGEERKRRERPAQARARAEKRRRT